MARSGFVMDVEEADFQVQVVEKSHELPIVVDFWAPWCGPCRTLGPLLEAETQRHSGQVLLAKVNVDHAQNLAAHFRIQGIPAVKAFRDGKIAAEFVGALPRAEVRSFFEKLLPGSPPRQGEEQLEPIRRLAEQGQASEALALLERLPLEIAELPETLALRARLRLLQRAGEAQALAGAGPLAGLYASALSAALEGRYPEALDALLSVVRRDRAWNDGAARKAMLEIFDITGSRGHLAEDYRQRLAMILF